MKTNQGTTSIATLAQAAELPREQVGGKAAHLGRMIGAGLPVPEGFVITVARLAELDRSGAAAWMRLADELQAACAETWPEGTPQLIVRSSAYHEDGLAESTAGLFRSIGAVNSPAELLTAITACRAARFEDQLTVWSYQRGIDPATLGLALIVQRQVSGDVMGVAMTVDPVTGRADELVLNVTEQSLEQLVQGEITPLSLQISKLYGLVRGAPPQPSLRLRHLLAQAHRLVALAAQVEALFGCAQDIEWLFSVDAGWQLVQARPVTSCPKVAPEPDWGVAPGFEGFRRSMAELAGGPLTPLFGSLGVPALQLGYTHALNQWSGGLVLQQDLFSIINGYLYMCNSFPATTKLRVATLLPRAINRLLIYERSQFKAEAQRYETAVTELVARDLSQLADFDLLLLAEQYMALAGRYYFYLQFGVLAGSYISEAAGRWLLEQLLPGAAKEQAGIMFQGLWSENDAAGSKQQLIGYLNSCQMVDLDFYQSGFAAGTVAPRMDPALVTEREALEAALARRHPLLSKPLRLLLRHAQHRARLRETGLARLGIAWGPARRTILELAQRMVGQGIITQPEGIFFLTRAELRAALHTPDSSAPRQELIRWRRLAHQALGELNTPYYLPQPSDLAAKVRLHRLPIGRRSQFNRRDVVHGIGVSRGRITGRVLVAHSFAEAAQYGGDEPVILVTRLVTPGWSPLFARIAGLVTDIGGTLSHSSILIRESGLPAVLGTGDATRRLKTGQLVELDGMSGIVQLKEP